MEAPAPLVKEGVPAAEGVVAELPSVDLDDLAAGRSRKTTVTGARASKKGPGKDALMRSPSPPARSQGKLLESSSVGGKKKKSFVDNNKKVSQNRNDDDDDVLITQAELALHDSPASSWIAIDGDVYDVTAFLARHPGGPRTLLATAGRDASESFRLMHPEKVRKMLPSFRIGTLVRGNQDNKKGEDDSVEVDETAQAFHDLDREFEKWGWYEKEPVYYAALLARLAVLLGTSITLLVHEQSPAIVRLFGAVLLGVFWQQVAFVGHDCGHNSVMRDRGSEFWLGIVVGNLLNGIDIDWWKSTHNVHHVAVNSVHYDPDIQHLPVLALDERFCDGENYSFYHMRFMPFDAISRAITRYQHVYFYPLMAVARFNLYVQSLCHIALQHYHAFLATPTKAPKSSKVTSVAKRSPRQELAPAPAPEPEFEHSALAPRPAAPAPASSVPNAIVSKTHLIARLLTFMGYFAWVTAVMSQVPGAELRFACVLTSHVVCGLMLHTMISASHFSRDMYNGRPCAELTNWVKLQLSGTLNYATSRAWDWLYGGLQFQIEHHLYPRLSRRHLRAASTHVEALCSKLGLEYHAISFYEANREVIITLGQCAGATRSE